jgi:hypothetical protein
VRSEAEGAPRVVEPVGVGEADVTPSSAVLCVAGLHPQDVLRNAGFSGDSDSESMRQQTLEKEVVSTSIKRSAKTTMLEIRAGVGTGLLWRTH